MRRFSHDFETFSELNLITVGTSRYSRHDSTEVLMLAWSFDGGPVEQWSPITDGPSLPDEVEDAILDPETMFYAWNASFERAIWKNVLGIDVDVRRWRDPMVLAHSLSFPGRLGLVGGILGVPDDKKKDARGKALIRKFCQPRKPTKGKPWVRATHETDPDEWQEFLDYNRQDVVAEMENWKRMRKWDLPAHEWELWAIDQEINDAGVPINMPAVRAAKRAASYITTDRLSEMREITGVTNPNSGAQLLPWLQSQGYPYEDLVKGHVAKEVKAVEANRDEIEAETGEPLDLSGYERVLRMRQEIAKASVKKYTALEQGVDEDGLLRNTLQFAGAPRTWRWSGRRFQPHNLPRPWYPIEHMMEQVVGDMEHMSPEELELTYGSVMDVLSSCLRPVAKAPPGYLWAASDLNAIENRVLGWLADDDRILDVFENNRDPYIDFATYMYNQPYDKLYSEYKAGDKSKRTIAKPGVLGCGYMLGPGIEYEDSKTGEMQATGLLGYAWNMGVPLTAAQSEASVKVWRATFEEAVQFWWAIDRAARECITTGNPQRVGHIKFDRSGPFLRMLLPSGRALHYCRPRIEMKMTPWKEMRPTITYEGQDQKTGHWARITTHPGKLTENADQAVARDILAHGIILARQENNMDVRLHVHDEILALVPEDNAEDDLKVLTECMATRPPWAKDLPLGTAGFTSRVFIKD